MFEHYEEDKAMSEELYRCPYDKTIEKCGDQYSDGCEDCQIRKDKEILKNAKTISYQPKWEDMLKSWIRSGEVKISNPEIKEMLMGLVKFVDKFNAENEE